MKQDRSFPKAVVTEKAEAAIKRGHPWVYDTEITSFCEKKVKDGIFPDDTGVQNGALTDVLSSKGRYLGTGFLSLSSKIRIRQNPEEEWYAVKTTRKAGPDDVDAIKKKQEAMRHRRRMHRQ